uniref:hypothetical protein n=1 Tax=Klebsiella pneumoniae TaxID=573 RepID=UPI003974E0C1
MALAARAGIPLETMYDVVTHAAGNSGCLRIACSTSRWRLLAKIRCRYFCQRSGLVNDTARALTFRCRSLPPR